MIYTIRQAKESFLDRIWGVNMSVLQVQGIPTPGTLIGHMLTSKSGINTAMLTDYDLFIAVLSDPTVTKLRFSGSITGSRGPDTLCVISEWQEGARLRHRCSIRISAKSAWYEYRVYHVISSRTHLRELTVRCGDVELAEHTVGTYPHGWIDVPAKQEQLQLLNLHLLNKRIPQAQRNIMHKQREPLLRWTDPDDRDLPPWTIPPQPTSARSVIAIGTAEEEFDSEPAEYVSVGYDSTLSSDPSQACLRWQFHRDTYPPRQLTNPDLPYYELISPLQLDQDLLERVIRRCQATSMRLVDKTNCDQGITSVIEAEARRAISMLEAYQRQLLQTFPTLRDIAKQAKGQPHIAI